MATIAGGLHLGISPNADLCLVKTKNTFRGRFNGPPRQMRVNPQALVWFLNQVETDIRERTVTDPGSRSVINMSWGKYIRSTPTVPVATCL
jgi:hypothetical protein